MGRTRTFEPDERLIRAGERDDVAYLIRSGWVEVRPAAGENERVRLGPGEIVGELVLTGLATERTATVTAVTRVAAEVIDRGTLIRLVNGPGNRLVPLLAALLSRLRATLVDESVAPAQARGCARLDAACPRTAEALCRQPCHVTRLPFVIGAQLQPRSVTDLFREAGHADLALAVDEPALRPRHLRIDEAEEGSGAMQLRLLHPGDFCELDETPISRRLHGEGVAPLTPGTHTLAFGNPAEPLRLTLQIPA